ncbi:MAG TPA: hypothetical protein VGK73_03370, partial [Polyangiaceae bacterium]
MLLGRWRASWGAWYGAPLLFGGLALAFGGQASGARGADASPASAASGRLPVQPALPATEAIASA